MKFSLYSKFAVLALLLLPAVNVFAATDNHKGGLSIGSSVQVGSTQLQAGDYAVKWDGAGPSVQVNIIRNGKVVATVPARVVELGRKSDHNQAETTAGANGGRLLTRLQFEGKTFALELSGETVSDAKSSGEMK
jgi:hypothetical protein